MRVSAPNPLVSSLAPLGKSGRSRYCYRGAQELTRGGLESVSPRAWLLVRELSLNTRRGQRGGGGEAQSHHHVSPDVSLRHWKSPRNMCSAR